MIGLFRTISFFAVQEPIRFLQLFVKCFSKSAYNRFAQSAVYGNSFALSQPASREANIPSIVVKCRSVRIVMYTNRIEVTADRLGKIDFTFSI